MAQSQFFAPGNVVVVVEGCGIQGATGNACAVTNGTGTGTGNSAAGGYGDNQGAPLTLFQFKPTGTASAAYVNAMVLPQTASGANLPLAGEYGSSSEGSVQLSGAGQYLTFMGYGINAATFDANPATYGAAPSLALAQSGSLTGQTYTPIPRVVILVDANGNVNSSTAIYNVFNTNNPRSIYTADGVKAYISGQGTGSGTDATGGVFYTALGGVNNAPTPITGLDTSANTLSQDTRNIQIYNGTLYVSVDTKGGSNNTRSYLGTLGTPPATSLYMNNAGPTELPLYNNAGTPVAVSSNGKLTLTASETNSINAAGQQINLSPSAFFFANAYTLYIADTGNSKQTSASNLNGDGGLQKWVNTKTDGTGLWELMYTMSTGLNLVQNPNAKSSNTTGATGLYSLAGVVNSDGTVSLYTVNYNIADLDQTYLYGITDTLSATTNPGNSFTKLATAPLDSNFKGVSLAPSFPAGSATITTVPSGLSVTTAGTGCVPGTYVTPVTLVWTPGSACTLSTTTPQTSAGTPYVFTNWQDNTTGTSDMVIAPATSATYTATFTNNYTPVGVLEKAVDNTTKSTNINVGDSILVSGWVADPVDGAPLSNVKVYVDGNVFGTPTLGIARPDVAAAYGASYTNSGYQLAMSTSTLALGTHAVTVVAVDSTGKTATFGPLSVNLVATPTVTVSSASIVFGTASTTLTASVAFTGAVAPMGGVSFTVNGSSAGVTAATCTAGASPLTCTATYTSSTLPVGVYPIVATEAASNTYTSASGTGFLSVTAATDFSFSATGTTSQTIARGSTASYTFSLKPLAASYPGAVSFSVSGLPAGATYTLTPASVTSTGGAQTETLVIQTSATAANARPSLWKPTSGVVLALCMLPVFLRRRLRSGHVQKLALLLAMCGSFAGFAGLMGCSSGLTTRTPVASTVTVTATSGGVQHAATVTLTVQ